MLEIKRVLAGRFLRVFAVCVLSAIILATDWVNPVYAQGTPPATCASRPGYPLGLWSGFATIFGHACGNCVSAFIATSPTTALDGATGTIGTLTFNAIMPGSAWGASGQSGGGYAWNDAGSVSADGCTINASWSDNIGQSGTVQYTYVGGGTGSLAVTTSSLPIGNGNTVYSEPLSATGGTQPYTWSIVSGQLPAGLSLSGNTITGTPTAPGLSDFTVQVTDSAGNTASKAFSIEVDCKVSRPVPPIPQSGGTWGGLAYDHLGPRTIGALGCGLTSLNMALNFAGQSWDPGTLNSLLNTSGYGKAGNVLWLPATAATNGGSTSKAVIFDVLGGLANSDVNLANAIQTVEKGICAATPLPVIVGVRSPKTGKYPGHYVLITGEIINSDGSKAFTINDPAYSTTLIGKDSSTGNNGYTSIVGEPEFWTRGTVHDPTDLTGLSVSVDAIANLTVTDPNGLQSGFDPSSPDPIQYIPNSGAGLDEIDDDVTGHAGGPTQVVMINSPTAGAFQFSLTGVAAGQYSLVISAEASDGSVQTSSFLGLTNVGVNVTYELSYDPTPGIPQPVTFLASYQSVIADIANSRALGLIDNAGIANALTSKIQAAQSAASSGQSQTAINILGAFENQVSAQTGKHITGVAPQVLQQDAASLISQNP